MNKAYKFRIYPNTEQQILLAKTFGCVRFIYNRMLADKIKYYEETKQKLNNTPAQYKKEFEWLKEVDSLALANAQINLQTAYNNFFSNPKKYRFPNFKTKHKSPNKYTTNNQKDTVKIENRYIKLPKIGLVKLKQHRNIPDDYMIKSVTISQNASGKYFASVLFEYDKEIVEKEPEKFIGLDFSMHELYVDSNGDCPDFPRCYRLSEKKLKIEQRKLSKMVKGSKNREKQRIKVAKLHEKIANQRKDFLHKQSRQIANVYDCVCIENLDMQAMAQSLNFGKSVSDNGWGKFTTFLKYKLEEMGKQLVKIDKFFASSQICSVCGYQNHDTKNLSVRKWICPCCQTHHNRDVNAAINIKNQGMRIVLS